MKKRERNKLEKMGVLDFHGIRQNVQEMQWKPFPSRRMFVPGWWSPEKRRKTKDSNWEPSQGGHGGPDPLS